MASTHFLLLLFSSFPLCSRHFNFHTTRVNGTKFDLTIAIQLLLINDLQKCFNKIKYGERKI